MPDRCTRILCFLVALVAMQTVVSAQGTVPRSQYQAGIPVAPGVPVYQAPGAEERTMVTVDPDRKLQQGDQLSFSIEEDRDPAVPLMVGASGDVRIEPLCSVHVAGHTVADASRLIKQRLEADFYYTATVRLGLERVNPSMSLGFVYISGEINRVGAVPIPADRPLTLSQAIIQSGGFTTFGDGKKVKVTRTSKGGATETIVKDVNALLQSKPNAEPDLTLQDGDRILVPRVWIKT